MKKVVHIFIPCFMDQLFPNTALNMLKILERFDCEVVYNTNQTCCGQPAYNGGYRNEAKDVCTKYLQDFADANIIVTPSASCAGFLHNYYPEIFDNSASHNAAKALKTKVIEFSDFLFNHLKVTDLGAKLSVNATYHDSCAALREYKLDKNIPRALLSKVQGLQLQEMVDTETCCGFGGTFAVKFDGISGAMADQKINNAINTGAEVIISTDISCLMHINGFAQKNNKNITTMHLADVLASGW